MHMRAAEWVVKLFNGEHQPTRRNLSVPLEICQQPCHKSTTLTNLYGEVTQFWVTSLLTEEEKTRTKLRYEPKDRRIVARFMTPRLALGPTQIAIKWVPGAPSPRYSGWSRSQPLTAVYCCRLEWVRTSLRTSWHRTSPRETNRWTLRVKSTVYGLKDSHRRHSCISLLTNTI